jgi:membrane-bound lytic murein transglycosylase MltF
MFHYVFSIVSFFVITNKKAADNAVVVKEIQESILEKKIEDNYDKEHMLKSMLSDILSSCREYEENKLLQDRYPELYEKVDADSLVKNLMNYIITMNTKNNLRL